MDPIRPPEDTPAPKPAEPFSVVTPSFGEPTSTPPTATPTPEPAMPAVEPAPFAPAQLVASDTLNAPIEQSTLKPTAQPTVEQSTGQWIPPYEPEFMQPEPLPVGQPAAPRFETVPVTAEKPVVTETAPAAAQSTASSPPVAKNTIPQAPAPKKPWWKIW